MDLTWRMGDVWVLLTDKSPREMGREPMSIYYPPNAPRRFQYVCAKKPQVTTLLTY